MPSNDRRTRITSALLAYVERGDSDCDELIGLVYQDLRRLATHLLRGERRGHTLSPTDLVHEAYAKLVDQTRVDWQGRTHFYAVAAQAMRRILIDYARRHGRTRRGGDLRRVTLDLGAMGKSSPELGPEELLALDDAMTRLAALDAREARVVELRFFVGLSNEEIAHVLGVSTRSVARDWMHARTWLRRELATAGGAWVAAADSLGS
jgi:RNA polymerase sigma factor (TIGR02999 family)